MAAIEERSLPDRHSLGRRIADSDAWRLVAVAALLPNALFLLVSPWFLIRRIVSPIVYLVAAFAAVFLPWPFAMLLFLAAAAVDVFFIFSYIFAMPFGTTLEALSYAGAIDITASLLYVAVIIYFATMPLLLTWLTVRYRPSLRAASPMLATVIAFGLVFVDYRVNGYKPLEPPPFDSAMRQNGLDGETIVARDRNLLIVLVEGMGAFADPQARAILAERLASAAAGRFRMASGTSRYFGSTTGAESRELCGKWATFVHYLKVPEQDCLPERLAAAGFRTTSYHAASSDMFSRRAWYPHIGIGKTYFQEDIERERPEAIRRRCGSVFPGLCDSDLGEMVKADIKAAGQRRGLYYWLTLNSHLPYDPVPENRFGCGTDEALIGSVIPCELTEIWAGVFDSVAAIMRDPATPPLDILVVGDHNTPMWSRDAYRHFVPDKVDWYFLEDRRTVAADPAAGVAVAARVPPR